MSTVRDLLETLQSAIAADPTILDLELIRDEPGDFSMGAGYISTPTVGVFGVGFSREGNQVRIEL